MNATQVTHDLINLIISFANGKLIPIMFAVFGVAIVFRFVLFYTIRREQWVIEEFEKRVEKDLAAGEKNLSFKNYTKKVLDRTYYEIFELRSAKRRRRPDMIMSLSDRFFLIEKGAAKFISDLSKRVAYFNGNDEQFLTQATVNSFERNESFSKSFGIFSNTLVNNILNVLPSIFIICGIFGTFIGIMAALPGLTGMDFSDPKIATAAMDKFLYKITFSMSTSIIGIILSVVMNVLNTTFQVESVYTKTVDKCVSTLKLIYNASCSSADSMSEDELPPVDISAA